ncbi:choice-of-anchor P family protein [Myceligenerans crystallogenes]
MRSIKLLPVVALLAAGGLVAAPAQAAESEVGPAAAGYYTGQAHGISATVELPLLGPIVVAPQPNTGEIETSQSLATDVDCTAEVSAIVLDAAVLCPSVVVDAAAGTSVAKTTIEEVSLNLLGVPAIVVEDLTATAASSCDGATGDVDLTLRVGDEVILVDDPNLSIEIPGGEIVVNRQVPAAEGTGIEVTAVVVKLEGLADIEIGHAESAVHYCS